MTKFTPMSYRTRTFCHLCNALGCLAVLISLGMFFATSSEAMPEMPKVADTRPHSLFSFGSEAALPAVLSVRDIELYQAAFRAQKKSDWATADASIKQIENKILLGHVLADRYLHRYKSNQNELVDWLTTYNDHPQAVELYTVAVTKIPAIKTRVPQITRQGYLDGYGDDNGLAALPDNGPDAQTWHSGLDAWRANNKAAAAKYFSSITRHREDLSPWMVSAAAYWSYRSYNALGNHAEARKYLRMAAEQPRSFYGILARKQLHETLSLDSAPIVLTDSDMLEMIGDPAIRRTIALTQIGMPELAEKELRAMFLQADNNERLRLLALAHSLNLASVQISMAKHVSADGALDYAKYPIPNWQPEAGFKVAPELMFALMRQESGFRASAVNPSGALGLMQLMPKTALLMQKNIGGDAPLIGNAADPVFNITLGQNYVRHLLDNELVQGNMFYMLAAYNAGPGRLQEWKKSLDFRGDPLLFVESIPFAQTRHYVMQVMTNYWIYSELADKPSNSVYAVVHGRWPSYDETSWPVADASM